MVYGALGETCFWAFAERVIELYKRAIAALEAKTATESDLETMSQQMLDFADRQASLAVIESLQAEHFDKYNPYKRATSSKRSAEDASQGPAAKRAATYADPNAGAAAGRLRKLFPYTTNCHFPGLAGPQMGSCRLIIVMCLLNPLDLVTIPSHPRVP